jgi:flavodoxin
MGACGLPLLSRVSPISNIRDMPIVNQCQPDDSSRRVLLSALAGFTFAGAAESASGIAPRRGTSRILVAFFSRSGNTRVIAGLIRRALATAFFEIEPATPYPTDYLETVEKATQERDRDVEPALKASVAKLAAYETLYLGFPIWGETAPPVIRSFLKAHDLAGKTLVPFITHGGYGAGSSRAVLASYAPKSRLQKGFLLQADQERQTMNAVNGWLAESGAIAARAG